MARIINMSDTEESVSSSSSESHVLQTSEDEIVHDSYFLPYQDEPLADSEDNGDQLLEEVNDLDGLTPSVLEARFEHRIEVSLWRVTFVLTNLISQLRKNQTSNLYSNRCSCGKCDTKRLVGA